MCVQFYNTRETNCYVKYLFFQHWTKNKIVSFSFPLRIREKWLTDEQIVMFWHLKIPIFTTLIQNRILSSNFPLLNHLQITHKCRHSSRPTRRSWGWLDQGLSTEGRPGPEGRAALGRRAFHPGRWLQRCYLRVRRLLRNTVVRISVVKAAKHDINSLHETVAKPPPTSSPPPVTMRSRAGAAGSARPPVNMWIRFAWAFGTSKSRRRGGHLQNKRQSEAADRQRSGQRRRWLSVYLQHTKKLCGGSL